MQSPAKCTSRREGGGCQAVFARSKDQTLESLAWAQGVTGHYITHIGVIKG